MYLYYILTLHNVSFPQMFAPFCLCARISGWCPRWHCTLYQFVGHTLSWHWTEHWVKVWSSVSGRHPRCLSPGLGWTIFLQALPDTRIPTGSWTQASCGVRIRDHLSYAQGDCMWGHPVRSPLTCLLVSSSQAQRRGVTRVLWTGCLFLWISYYLPAI